jgi:DNA polymerase-1
MPNIVGNRIQVFGPTDVELADQVKSAASNCTLLGLDTEFTSLNYWDKEWKLRLVQFGRRQSAFVLDAQDEAHRELIKYVLENVPEFTTHDNADALAIKRGLGLDITDKIHDTKTMAQLLWPGPLEEHALKPLCTRHLDDGLEQAEQALHAEFRKMLGVLPYDPDSITGRSRLEQGLSLDRPLSQAQKGQGFAEIPLNNQAYINYAALDAVYDLLLYYKLEALLYEKGAHRADPPERDVRAIATRMQLRGMRVSPDRAHELLDDYGTRHDAAQEEFADKYGCLAKSPKRIQIVLDSGVAIPTRTAKGNYSLGKATVEELALQHPDNEPLRILNEVAQTSNTATFLRTLLNFIDEEDLVHPDFNTLGAVTGRWTVTDPAIQTVAGINRSVFIPRSGHVIVSADLGQIEPRVAVGLAGETNLIPDLLNGSDVYSAAATLAFGDYTDKQRKQIKRVILGTLYASGVATLVKQARLLDGWLDADAKTVAEVRNLWKQAAPRVEEYSRYLQYQKEIVLESGRWIPQEKGREYKAINSMCQGTARDALMDRLRALSAGGLDQYLIATMHDEILLDVPTDALSEVIRSVRSVMEMGYNGIPTPTDIEIFPDCWGGKGIPVDDFLF